MNLLEAARKKAQGPRPNGGHMCLACQSPYLGAIREVLTDMRENSYRLAGTEIHALLVEHLSFPQGVNSLYNHLRTHERTLWTTTGER